MQWNVKNEKIRESVDVEGVRGDDYKKIFYIESKQLMLEIDKNIKIWNMQENTSPCIFKLTPHTFVEHVIYIPRYDMLITLGYGQVIQYKFEFDNDITMKNILYSNSDEE